MLELHADQLRFSFPEITTALRALVEAHTAAHLPRVLAEDRSAALRTLFGNAGQWRAHAGDAEFRARAEREAAALGTETLTETFRRLAVQRSGLSASEDPAWMGIDFQRTLRIPDDGREHSLPAGLGRFSLRMVDDFAATVPARWRERGGVLMPMYQAEAMWINFDDEGYPFAVKIAAGKVNAATGDGWQVRLHRRPAQDYVVLTRQPWLDGFAVGKGVIRQFVAMPLGSGHSVEEQVTGAAEHGGVQVQVYPLRAEVYFEETIAPRLPGALADVLAELIAVPRAGLVDYATLRVSSRAMPCAAPPMMARAAAPDMGLGAGGKMRQEIYADKRPLSDWDQNLTSRCFVHLCNSFVWREITGSEPPQPPVTAAEYARYGMPWFDYYREDAAALPGSSILAAVKSVFQIGKEKGDAPLAGDGPVAVKTVHSVGPALRPGQVREWTE